MKLGRIKATRKSGAEEFNESGRPLGINLQSFWEWASSDLLDNTVRGIVAEYLVAQALGQGTSDIRDAWSPHDLKTKAGTTIQVKSAAYVQAWQQRDFSTIQFVVTKTRAFNPDTGILEGEKKRHSDIYVFALHENKDQDTIDPMDVNQWVFYVLQTRLLDERRRSQHSITLKSLVDLCKGNAVRYGTLRSAIEDTEKTLSNQAL